MNSALHLLGIARKAGRVEIGEEPVGSAVRAGHARLVLAAADAAENSVRRAAHLAEGSHTPWLRSPFSKGELGRAVGRASCAVLAITDFGLASAVAGRLAAGDPDRYGGAAAELEQKAAKALQRQKERRAHEKNLRQGKRKPWAPPPEKAGQTPQKRRMEGPSKPPKKARPVSKGIVTVKAGRRGKAP